MYNASVSSPCWKWGSKDWTSQDVHKCQLEQKNEETEGEVDWLNSLCIVEEAMTGSSTEQVHSDEKVRIYCNVFLQFLL